MSASAVEVDVARVGLSHSFHVHVPVLAAELTQRAVATQLSGATYELQTSRSVL